MKLVYRSSHTPGTAPSAVPINPIDQITVPSLAPGASLFHASDDRYMFTKFVVNVASVSSPAPETPRPTACSIAPGSLVPAARAATAPSGIIQMLVAASARNTAVALPAAERV